MNKSKSLSNNPISSTIQEKIQAWKDKKYREMANLKFSTFHDKDDEKRFRLEYEIIKKSSQEHPVSDVIASSLTALSGSANEDYTRLFITQASGAMVSDADISEDSTTLAINAFQGGMISMKPKDIIEAQLCAKLMILHSKAMLFMNKATCATNQKVIDQNINNATKCMRLHNETLEALTRYRRKGEQRVKVVHQYVQVNEGGQAVVTGEIPRGGDKKKK
jgi:hypothetical protein